LGYHPKSHAGLADTVNVTLFHDGGGQRATTAKDANQLPWIATGNPVKLERTAT